MILEKSMKSDVAMNQRIPWDIYESVLLLDTYFSIQRGIKTRKEAEAELSSKLRQKAINAGMKIDDIYRNQNGMDIQLSKMEYIVTNGYTGWPGGAAVFYEAFEIYQKDRPRYEKLLREAKAMVEPSVEELFYQWLSARVSPAQLSEFYMAFTDIESFCISRKILHKPLFQTTNLDVLREVLRTVESNKVFRFSHNKRFLRKISSAIRFYLSFIKENADQFLKSEQAKTAFAEQKDNDISKKEEKQIEQASDTVIVDLSQIRNYDFTTPVAVSYFDDTYFENTWKSIYVRSCKLLADDYPHVFAALCGKSMMGNGCVEIGDESDAATMSAPEPISDTYYVETNQSTTDFMKHLRMLLERCNVDYENLKIEYKRAPLRQNDDTSADHRTASAGCETDEQKSNRIQFIDWMQKQGLKTTTILSYLSAVKQCGEFAHQHGLLKEDLLFIRDAAKIEQLIQQLLKNHDFLEWNNAQHNRFRAALTKYAEFRKCNAPIKESSVYSEIQSQVVLKQFAEPDSFEIPSKTAQQYTAILREEFEDGFRLNHMIDLNRFKLFYSERYGSAPEESDERIVKILQSVGFTLDGRIYAALNSNQQKLIEEIHAEIQRAFREGATCVYLEAIMQRYENRLADELQIYHVDALKELLLSTSNGAYESRYSYLYRYTKSPNTKQDVVQCLKASAMPMTYSELHNKLWYIPLDKIKNILITTPSIVNVDSETYFYAPNLALSEDELQKITGFIQRELEQKAFMTDSELKTWIDANCPSVRINNSNFTVWGFRNALSYLLKDKFSFQGRIISKAGQKFNMADVFAQFAREHENLTLAELKAFAEEVNGGAIYWESVLNEMVRVTEERLVRNDQITFDVDAVDAVLDEICTTPYVPIKSISLYLHFPPMPVQWNKYLLESYVYRYSQLFCLMHVGFNAGDCCGVIVRKSSPFKDYNAVVLDFLTHSDEWHDKKSALELLVEHGYQKRRTFTGIEQIIQEAKRRKAQMKEQEN